MEKKDKLLNIAYVMILLGFVDVIVRRHIPLLILYSLNDFFWIVSATLLILAISKYKSLAIIPLIVGMGDELLQYFHLYPEALDKVYSSTADINDVIAYVLGFLVAIIIYKVITREKL